MTDPKLKSLVERAEKIIEERKSVSADLTDIFSEAKGVGYQPKFLRKIIAERAMDAADLAEQEAVMDAYRHALGMVAASVSNGDMSLREAARQSGFSKSAIHRVSHQMRDSASGTVEMTADDLGTWGVDAASTPPREMVADDLGDPLLITNPFKARVKAIAATVSRPKAQAASDTVIARAPDDDLEFPAALDRRQTVRA